MYDKILDKASSIFELKPCPFCGGMELDFTYNEHRGHGDMSYTDFRIVCENPDCLATKGVSNWGGPDDSSYLQAVAAWNRRDI